MNLEVINHLIDFHRRIGHIWTMILNNHMFNLYIRSSISHRGPRHRPVPAAGETSGTHVWQSYSPAYASAKRAKHMQFRQFKTNSVQFIWQWATYECLLHRYAAQGWIPLLVVTPPGVWFSVFKYVETLKVCHIGERPPTTVQCRVTEGADKSSRQLFNSH